jgi:hypothetical protein
MCLLEWICLEIVFLKDYIIISYKKYILKALNGNKFYLKYILDKINSPL